MSAAWLTDAQIKSDLKNMLAKKSTATISDRWDGIITRANGRAKSDILKVLRASGYSTTNINGWDYLSEHHSMQSLFWCLTMGTALHNLEYSEVKVLDCRKDLKELDTLDINGEEVEPGDRDDVIQEGGADFTGSDFRPDSPLGDINFPPHWKTSQAEI